MKTLKELFGRAIVGLMILTGSAAPLSAAPSQTVSAPSFTAVTVEGSRLSSSSLSGKAYIVNFFASWCPPCRSEIPDMVSLQKQYEKQGFTFVGVAVNETEPTIRSFMKKNGITYPVIMVNQSLVSAYGRHVEGGLSAIPTSFVIDASGNLTGVIIGPRSYLSFDQIIKNALAVKTRKQ
jgi:thiol-disulfide isomerase/thioredoxin